jgi:hypothetical protein
MTGTTRVAAEDDLGAKTLVDALNPDEVVHDSTVQMTQVISMKEVPGA